MKLEIIAVISDQKVIITVESDNEAQCCLLRRTICTALSNQVDALTLLEIKEG